MTEGKHCGQRMEKVLSLCILWMMFSSSLQSVYVVSMRSEGYMAMVAAVGLEGCLRCQRVLIKALKKALKLYLERFLSIY